jgi:hypothetical protein
MKTILVLLFAISVAYAAEDCENCVDPNQPLQALLNPGITNSLQSLEDIAGCDVPDVGSAVRHNLIGNVENRVPNNSQFVLRRPAAKSWVVEFNATYTAGPGVTAEQARQMEERTKQCFAQAAPAMVGPDGHRMRMQLRTASSPNPVAPVIPITVVPTGRGNANTFSMDFNCATIIHEYLHHAGLCDEYPEGDTVNVTNSSQCRTIVRKDSIMSGDMENVYDETVGLARRCIIPEGSKWRNATVDHLAIEMSQTVPEIMNKMSDRSATENGWCTNRTYPPSAERPAIQNYSIRTVSIQRGFEIDYPSRNLAANATEPLQYRLTCRCPANNAQCTSIIQEARRVVETAYRPENQRFRCPSGSQASGAGTGDMPVGLSDQREQGYVEYRGAMTRNVSMLHPAHFMRVLRGSCRAIDQQMLYDRCAQFAYRHSMPLNAPADCSTVPADCSDPLKFLGGERVAR